MKIFYNVAFLILTLFSPSITCSFEFTFDPIDAVIPCHEKDKRTIELVIEGIRKNVHNLGRIIVVSAAPLTDKAEWFDERNFPFTKETIAYEIFKNESKAIEFIESPETRIGWIYQQLLKTYSMFIIPDLSPNMLIVDADTIFLRPVSFQDPQTGAGLYNPGSEHTDAYFAHNAKVLPGWKKVFPQYSGISHHMLFQKSVMEALFNDIRAVHQEEPWKVFCHMIDHSELFRSCMCIEYELYFNYVFTRSDQVKIRHLRWDNIPLHRFNTMKSRGFDFLSCHAYMS